MERYIYSLILLSVSLLLFANVKVIDMVGCNLDIVDVSDNKIELINTSNAFNWFAGVFENIDTTTKTTFRLDMADIGDESLGLVDVGKWEGLWPVYTYGKYLDYNTYIYYTKNNNGYWVSSDPFLTGDAKLAGTNKTPVQNVIPAELAEEFLSEDGMYWSAWAYLKDTKASTEFNTFTITNQFSYSTASISMRVPYTYDFHKAYMNKLIDANIPGVNVHNIGKGIKEHDLYIVEINHPDTTEEDMKNRKVVLLYANEDGDEPDSSWIVNNIISFLISGSPEATEALKDLTFLCIPMFDPIGWEEATYGAFTYQFTNNSMYDFTQWPWLIPDGYKSIRSEVISYLNLGLDKNRV